MVEMAIFNMQRAITLKTRKTRVTVNVFCMSSHGVTFVSSFMKIYQVVLKL